MQSQLALSVLPGNQRGVGLEAFPEDVFHMSHLGGPSVLFAWSPALRRRGVWRLAADAFLDCPNGETLLYCFGGDSDRQRWIFECQEWPCVAQGKRSALQHRSDFGRQLQHALKVRDGRAILPDQGGDLVLGQAELGRKPRVAFCLFYGI